MTDPREAFRPDLTPVKVPRWVFLLKYAGFATFGVYAVISGTPTFDLTTPEGYRPVWAAAVIVTAAVCFIACLFGWWRVEEWVVLGLSSFLIAYVWALSQRAWVEGDDRAQAITVLVVTVLILPVSRFLTLAYRAAKLNRPATPAAENQEGPED